MRNYVSQLAQQAIESMKNCQYCRPKNSFNHIIKHNKIEK